MYVLSKQYNFFIMSKVLVNNKNKIMPNNKKILNILYCILSDFKLNEINVLDPNISQGWMNSISTQQNEIITPFPIKIQQSLGILDSNNLPINNSNLHPSEIHTCPQTLHVIFIRFILKSYNLWNM